MRIVFATHAYAPAVGGAERYAQGLAEAMARAGHDVHVVTPATESAEAFYEYGHRAVVPNEETLSGVHIHRLDLRPPVRRWRMGRKSGPIPIDSAHRMWAEYAEAVAREISDIRPEATVTLPHTFPNVEAAVSVPDRGLTVYVPLLHEEDPAWKTEPIARLIAMTDIAVALTPWEKNRLEDSYGAAPARTLVAPPAANAPSLGTVRAAEHETPFVIALGRRTPSKNLIAVARTVQALNSTGISVHLFVVGPGSDASIDADLRTFAPYTTVVGAVTEERKWQMIKGAAALVSLSTVESYGIGIVEAWAMGRPAIALRTAPTASIIEDGSDGFLVDDEKGLATAITRCLASPDEASRMGAAGISKTHHTYDISAAIITAAVTDALST